jgi:hypothetical protein
MGSIWLIQHKHDDGHTKELECLDIRSGPVLPYQVNLSATPTSVASHTRAGMSSTTCRKSRISSSVASWPSLCAACSYSPLPTFSALWVSAFSCGDEGVGLPETCSILTGIVLVGTILSSSVLDTIGNLSVSTNTRCEGRDARETAIPWDIRRGGRVFLGSRSSRSHHCEPWAMRRKTIDAMGECLAACKEKSCPGCSCTAGGNQIIR